MTVRFVHDEHGRDRAEVERICEFVLDATGPLRALAIRLRAPSKYDYPNGRASYWVRDWCEKAFARSREQPWYSVEVHLITDESKVLGEPRVCWHASLARRSSHDDDRDGYQPDVLDALAAGKTKLGRWPIYRSDDWREALVHTLAHELSHIVQRMRTGPGGRQSEVLCEQFALATLLSWRASQQ